MVASGLVKKPKPRRFVAPLLGDALLMAVLGASIVLGGGGVYNPLTEMLLELLIIACMVPLCVSNSCQQGLGKISPMAWLLAAIVLCLPLAQLIPLPPAVWQALPGRGVEVRSVALAGMTERWMPLSMAPARTFTSLLSMMFPALLLLQFSRLSIRGRRWLCVIVAIVGACSIILGILQISRPGGAKWSLYPYFSEGFLCGFQGNRNHQADILHIALLALGAVVAPRVSDGRRHLPTWIAMTAATAIFLIGILMTGSRTGIVLSGVTIALLLAMFWPAIVKHRRSLRWLVASSFGLTVLAFGLLQLNSVQRVMERFSLTREGRWGLWLYGSYVLDQVWPIGAGIGTIVPLLEASERLEVLGPSFPNRVHNDWLEWTIEGGVPGIATLVVALLVLAIMAVRAFRRSALPDADPSLRSQIIFACGALLILALHSIVDYPLRTMSLAILAALAAGLLTLPAPMRQAVAS